MKNISKIPDNIHLLSPHIIESISNFKKDVFGAKKIILNLEETLITLSISATTNSTAKAAMENLKELMDVKYI
jgi:uncharacterized protein (UPF0371 family)